MAFLGDFGKGLWDVTKAAVSIVPGVGTYLGSRETSDAMRDANASNLQAVRETNAANAALWREQTEYNTPINQMKRLEAAGLNPNLAYGQVADSKMASAPTMESPRVQAVPGRNYSGFSLADYAQVLNLAESNKLIRANTAKAEADADYAKYETAKLKSSGMLKSDTATLGGLFRYVGRNAFDRLRGSKLDLSFSRPPDFYPMEKGGEKK